MRMTYAVAVTLLDQALALAEQADDRRAVGSIIHQLGRIALRAGDGDRAADLAHQVLAIHEDVGWTPGIAAVHEAIGAAFWWLQHRPDDALEHHRHGLRRAIEVGAPAGILAKLLEGLAGAALRPGRPRLEPKRWELPAPCGSRPPCRPMPPSAERSS